MIRRVLKPYLMNLFYYDNELVFMVRNQLFKLYLDDNNKRSKSNVFDRMNTGIGIAPFEHNTRTAKTKLSMCNYNALSLYSLSCDINTIK